MKSVKSLFVKNFFIYALVIVFSFMILGSVFIYQVNRFSVEEKQNLLEETTAKASENTLLYMKSSSTIGWKSEFGTNYLLSMRQLASDCKGRIYVGDSKGRIVFIATESGCYTQKNGVIPDAAFRTVKEKGIYTAQSNFFGYLPAVCYVMGTTVGEAGATNDMVFVAVPMEATAGLFFNLSRTFVLMTIVVLLLTILVTYIVVHSTVKPLKQIAGAASAFAKGDFSSRVPLPKRQDEIYEMTLSFNQLADAMENAENTRRGLIANVSHDLRTPMTTIGGFVDGILDGTIKPEKQSYYLTIISDEVKRLSRMADSMVQVSRLESGEVALAKKVFDMSEMVRRIVIGFEQKLNEKHVEVTLGIPEITNISADHDGIFQAVYNLVDNAVKFVNDGGTISISMLIKGGSLQVNVVNTGSEVDAEGLKHIFERFYKGDKSRGQNKTGSGLGLYITKTVINRHNGDIYAQSGDGKTEFCFTIPVR